MLNQLFKDYKIVLGSNSPRRKAYLGELGLDFTVRASDTDESYPLDLQGAQITDYIALAKSNAIEILDPKEILITSDTTVWLEGKSLGKPKDKQEAFDIIQSMCNKEHQVITSVVLRSLEKVRVFNCVTLVVFADLTPEQIHYYIDQYKPYDKAGAYGIQEWIGLVGIKEIKGSYPNIVGLPTYELVQELINFIK
ncbi:Maf family nucleotide pyrophosphatase [Myroides sp. LJL115]